MKRLAVRVRPLGYWFSPDGARIAYTTSKGAARNTQQPYFDIVLLDVADGRSWTIASNVKMDYGISVSWSPDGQRIAYTDAGQQAEGECFLVDALGHVQRATDVKHPSFADDHRAPLWDSAGRALYFVGAGALWRVDIATRAARRGPPLPDWTVREIVAPHGGGRFWSPDGGRTLLVSMRNNVSKRMTFAKVDAETLEITLRAQEDKTYGGIFTTDAGHDRFVFAIQDAQHPPDLWVAGTDLSDRRRITHINPQLESYTFGASRLIDWRGTDGEALQGALLLPSNYQPGVRYPLVVNVYGGALRSNNLNGFGLLGSGVDNMQLLATRGYAVLAPDAPLHDGTPMQDLAKTVLPGVDKAIEIGIADPNRLAVMGHSYGGYSALAIITQTTRFKAAVVSAGSADMVAGYSVMTPDGSAWAIGWSETGQGRMAGTPWQYRSRYLENSPIFYFDRIQTPVLVVQGALDATNPVHLADQVFVALRRLGKDVAYARYEGEEHWQGTWRPANVVDYWNRVIEWLGQHLREPASVGQKQ